MAPTGQPDSIMVTFDDGGSQRLTILRLSLPRGTGTALFYRCSWCQKPRRYLYLLTLSGAKLVSDLGLRCQECAHSRFGSQGQYRSAFSRLWGTRPRYPWDPRAVSHPWLQEEEFGRRRTPTASGVEYEQGQAALEAQAKTTRTVPLEFEDTATGEHFDVIQDDDLAPDPGEDPRDETRERGYARAEREVQGGRRGPTVRPALAVSQEIMDEATGAVFGSRGDAALPRAALRVSHGHAEARHWIATEQPEAMREAIERWCEAF